MCTVTLVFNGTTDFFLTSNRDEAPEREAMPPSFYKYKGVRMCFPMDKQAKGTWIGISSNKRAVCLLNGGFKAYERKDAYRLSRGIIVKDVLAFNDLDSLENLNLKGVEPFTLIIVDWNASLLFKELVFDGDKIHIKKLSLTSHIWSSSSLYSKSQKKERQAWFAKFKNENNLTSENLLAFHTSTEKNNLDYGVIMNRGFVKTTSISQIIKKDKALSLSYLDLGTNKNTTIPF